MLVEIYSDVVCPWCYIGKRRFEEALNRFEGREDVTVVWRPFQLDPHAPATPTPVADAYARKFGGPEQAMRIVDKVTTTASGEGLDFHLDIAQRSNTFDAHRLIAYAGRHDRQDALKERLLRAYFTDGLAVSDRAVLADLAADVGLDRADVVRFLASDEGTAELREELLQGLERGVTAVPTFVFENKWAVPGAQDADTMLRVLQTVAERITPATTTGDACDDDACAV
ncbi:MAG TPA: DsbA family oxidoreductase [Acidimicrobiales bacterium]|nr:DsbA family oxidoreductase [Acidimicrobiales bacterium]